MWELAESAIQSKLFWSTAFFFGIYLYLKFVIFNYWRKQGVLHDKPMIPLGNAMPLALGKMCIGELIQKSYEHYKSQPFHGIYMFHIPHLVINDPDLMRLMMVKNFNHFHDRGLYYNNEVDPLSGHLFFMPGDEWKYLRSKLSPTFTSGKMKQMFPLIERVGNDLRDTLGMWIEKSDIVEVRELLSRYTTDMIASIAFGVECNSLRNPDAVFRVYGKKALDVNPLKVTLVFFFPKLLDLLRIPFNHKDVSKFFSDVFSEVIAHRRTNRVIRKDFLNLLLQLIEHGEVEDDENTINGKSENLKTGKSTDTINMSEACAQAFVFFLAGFETSSSTATFCLHELAMNVEIQDKLRQEIKDTLGDSDELTYEAVHAMPYLEKVISETLRKHPVVPILNRVCIKDYNIPNSDICIKKGMNVIIPVVGLHRDPEIYPNPQEFIPERFDSDKIAARHSFAYMPFGEGPRNCIGKRFALLQVKVALIKILSNYKISLSEKTEIPIIPTKRSLMMMPENDVFLKVERV